MAVTRLLEAIVRLPVLLAIFGFSVDARTALLAARESLQYDKSSPTDRYLRGYPWPWPGHAR